MEMEFQNVVGLVLEDAVLAKLHLLLQYFSEYTNYFFF